MAQSVKRPTSAQVMISRSVSSSPALGSVLMAQSLEPAFGFWVSLSLGPSPASLSLKNKHQKIFKNFKLKNYQFLGCSGQVSKAPKRHMWLMATLLDSADDFYCPPKRGCCSPLLAIPPFQNPFSELPAFNTDTRASSHPAAPPSARFISIACRGPRVTLNPHLTRTSARWPQASSLCRTLTVHL